MEYMSGNFSEDNKYSQQITVQCYESDSAFRLKADAFMNYAQEIAYRAATHLGFGYDELQKREAAWVLSRLHLIVDNAPLWRDRVTLTTWHKGLSGPFFLRDFELSDATGNIAVRCTSSWITINTASRRMLRSTELTDIVPDSTMVKTDAIEEPCPKVIMPRGAAPEKAGEHRVSYSDIDIVGHTNNVKYVEWAIDCIDYRQVSEKGIREVYVNFNHETHPGETVSLYRHRADDGSWYVAEMVGETCAACVRIVV